MARFSCRRFLSCLLLISFSLVVFSQSGRKVQRTAPVPEPKPTPAPLAPPAPAPASAVSTDTIRVDTTLIPVPVAVTDHTGRYVPFLKPQNFTIYEDGLPQPIAHFSDDWVPFHIVLMLDVSESKGAQKAALLQAAKGFVERLRPHDRAMVTLFDGGHKTLCDFTTNQAELHDAIDQVGKRKFGRFETSLNRTLQRLITTNLASVEGRKAIVLFTDGMDQGTFTCAPSREEVMRNPHREEPRLPQRTFNLIEENGVVIYPILHDPHPQPTQNSGTWTGAPPILRPNPGWATPTTWLGSGSREDLRRLAESSAGRFFSADTLTEVTRAFQWISEDIGHQYLLGYYPSKPLLPGQTHRLTVKVDGEAVRVRARQSYRVPQKKV